MMTMREILFRGERVDNGEWVYGAYGNHTSLDAMIIDRPYLTSNGDLSALKFWTVNPTTVGQFTGLTDKNGTKIFEGDILDVSAYVIEGYGIVKFGEHKSGDMSNDYPCGNLGFYIDFPDKKNQYVRKDILYFVSECKVVGNIHDNPELLEKNNE